MCSASSTGLDSAKFRGIHVKEKCAAVQRVTAWPLSHLYHELDPRTPPRPRIDQTRSKGTPRRHKTPKRIRNLGIKAPHESIHEIQEELKRKLKLTFTPEEWQACLIQRVKQGYDSIFLAGTGYGKSLVFEGLAALGGQRRVTIVISPLKSLQKDQVRELVKDKMALTMRLGWRSQGE
jgi:superfamily II RNA helicase